MENKATNQENQNQMRIRNNSKNGTNIAVRRLLASSALATAIISWIATAQGLRIYVFSYYWQAAIISAAIQGTLFAFSIKAIPLMKRLRIIGKIAMWILWFCILLSSSIFSYVYISKNVYSDSLLHDDSNRIMFTQYLEIYSLLDDIIDMKKEDLETKITEYIELLVKDDGTVETEESDQEKTDKSNQEESDKMQKFFKENVTENTNELLEQIKSGSYSENDVNALKELLDSEKTDKNNQIKDKQNEIAAKENNIRDIESRLKTFSNVNSSSYHDLVLQLNLIQSQKDELLESLSSLRSLVKMLNDYEIEIEYIEGGLDRKLYNETLDLRKYLNQDKINTDDLLKTAENVYNILFENNITNDDNRLSQYKSFKTNVTQYATLVNKENIINEERERLYNIFNLKPNENKIVTEGEENTETDKEQKDYQWEDVSRNLQNILKDIPQTYFDEYFSSSINESLKYSSKNNILEISMNMDRLYLSDLNDFERAWTLLRSDIHIYKTLLWFSVIFAFGMDLFSFGTGLLLYFMDNEKKIRTNHKRVCLKKWVCCFIEKLNCKNKTFTK